MRCPYCLGRVAKVRFIPVDEEGGFVYHSCDVCQKGVDKAIKNRKLVQRRLLVKYE